MIVLWMETEWPLELEELKVHHAEPAEMVLMEVRERERDPLEQNHMKENVHTILIYDMNVIRKINCI